MKSDSNYQVLDFYKTIIEITCERVSLHLKNNFIHKVKYDITYELKKRWLYRTKHALENLDKNYKHFYDKNQKFSESQKDYENSYKNLNHSSFPVICTLVWDFYKYYDNKNQKITNFKLWVWGCLISHIIDEGTYPLPSRFLQRDFSLPKKIKLRNFSTKKSAYDKFMGIFYQDIFKNMNSYKIQTYKNNSNKINYSKIKNTSDLSLDPITSSEQELDKNNSKNFIVSMVEKIYRRNTKWRVILKDGVICINDKEMFFNFCKCELFW